MNTNELELLRNYKLQNPRKYALKFGNKTPEEVVLPPSPLAQVGSVVVEVGEAKKDLPVEPENLGLEYGNAKPREDVVVAKPKSARGKAKAND